MKEKSNEFFKRSIHIREVDTGSCSACEWEITALLNGFYDIQRYGIDFVASPRHADMLLVTGPVSRNMEVPLREVVEATPSPRRIVAVGDCAINGGIFGEGYACKGGVGKVVPVDLSIPGCPPTPEEILKAIINIK